MYIHSPSIYLLIIRKNWSQRGYIHKLPDGLENSATFIFLSPAWYKFNEVIVISPTASFFGLVSRLIGLNLITLPLNPGECRSAPVLDMQIKPRLTLIT